jgi:hypothetical protein
MKDLLSIDNTDLLEERIEQVRQQSKTSQTSVAAAPGVTTSTAVVKPVMSVSATESPAKQQDRTFSLVSVTFTRDPSDNNFAGARIWFTGYKGNTTPMLMTQGTDSPVSFLCETTNEWVTVTVQSYGSDGSTVDFASCATTTVQLDGVISATSAPSISQSLTTTPIGYQFAFNQLAGLAADVVDGYRIYRNPVNNPGTATQRDYVKHNPVNSSAVVYQDTVASGTNYFYWVSAVNTTGLESSLTAAQPGIVANASGLDSTGEAVFSLPGGRRSLGMNNNLVLNGDFSRGDNRNWQGAGFAEHSQGSHTVTVAPNTNTVEGGYAATLIGNQTTLIADNLIPVNTGKLYYLELRVWRTDANAPSAFYGGFVCFDKDKNWIPYSPPSATFNYCLAASATIPTTPTTFRAVVSGEELIGSGGVGSAQTSANKFRYGTKYIAPLILGNFTPVTGCVMQIDYFRIVEISDAIAQHPQLGQVVDTTTGTIKTTALVSGKGKLIGDVVDLSSGQYGSNLLENASFEVAANDPLQVAAGWRLTESVGANCFFLGRDTAPAQPFAGTACLYFEVIGGQLVPASTTVYLGVSSVRTFPLKAKDWCVIRAKARVEAVGASVPAGLSDNAYILLRVFYTDGSRDDYSTNILSDANVGTGWQTLGLTRQIRSDKTPTFATLMVVVYCANSTGGNIIAAGTPGVATQFTARFDQLQLLIAINPTSDELLKLGSTPPSFNGSLSYSSTDNSIAWSWNIDVLRTDSLLSSQNITGSQTCTGLSASTTYFQYPFMDEGTLTMGMVATGGVGSPSWAHTSNLRAYLQEQSRQDHCALSVAAVPASTAAPAGTSSGTGAGDGSCLRKGTWVKERTRGNVLIETVKAGEYLWSENDTWLLVLKDAELIPQDIWVKFRFNCGQMLEATPSHPWTLRDRTCKRSPLITILDEFNCTTGVTNPALIEVIREHDFKAVISCESPHVFWAATDVNASWVLTHNMPMPT